jgi:hypothetical protein
MGFEIWGKMLRSETNRGRINEKGLKFLFYRKIRG